MSVRNHHRLCYIALFAITLPSSVLAAQPGWYVAIDGGQAHYNGIAGNAQQWVSTPPSPTPAWLIGNPQSSLQRSESSDTGYRLTIGYQFNPYLGVEGGYVTFGGVRAAGDGSVGMALANGFLPLEAGATFTDTAKLRTRGWELAATGSWPLNPQWSLLGRAGAFDSHTKLDIASTPTPPFPGALIAASASESNSSWTPTFGVGVSFSPVNHWAVRLDWDRYAHLGDRNTIMGRFNINLLSLGIMYIL